MVKSSFFFFAVLSFSFGRANTKQPHTHFAILIIDQTIGDYFSQFLVGKFGLRSVAHKYMFKLVPSTIRLSATSKRLKTFGIMTGIINYQTYSPLYTSILFAFFKHALDSVFDSFKSLTAFLTDDPSWIPAQAVKDALIKVFTLESVCLTTFQMQLHDNVWKMVQGKLAEIEIEETNREKAATSPTRFRFDDVAEVIVDAVAAQNELNRQSLGRVFEMFSNNDLGTLSFPDFTSMIRHCCPSLDSYVLDETCFQLFQEMSKWDGISALDSASKQSMIMICESHGITPPYKNTFKRNSIFKRNSVSSKVVVDMK